MENDTTAEVKRLDLKPVKSVVVSFDPWRPDCQSAQQLFYNLSLEKVRLTNLSTSIRMDVKSDASAPTVGVTFNDDSRVLYKTADLNLHEILFHLNVGIHGKKPPPKKP